MVASVGAEPSVKQLGGGREQRRGKGGGVGGHRVWGGVWGVVLVVGSNEGCGYVVVVLVVGVVFGCGGCVVLWLFVLVVVVCFGCGCLFVVVVLCGGCGG